MFIHLSKKIAIPNSKNLNCIAWNKNQGFIACGGGEGLLKCLQLDSSPETTQKGKLPANLTMNQTLEGHSGEVQVITWNETHQKLTSSDQNGLIIVWMLYKGSWHEEMVNNRNKSVVRGMAWDAEGKRICIVYEDGAVIVGSVDGNRIWGKELKSASPLTGVEWSPDGKMLLFSVKGGEVHGYDNKGNQVMVVVNHCLSQMNAPVHVAGIHWYKARGSYVAPDRPVLAICYKNGYVQLMRSENDPLPILIDLSMQAACVRWSHDGNMLAVSGKSMALLGTNGNNVQFFNPYGEHLATLKVPGKSFAFLEWEKNSLRLAFAADSYIFFANLRFEYKWTFYDQTLVYTYLLPESNSKAVAFWDTRINETCTKYLKEVLSIGSYGQHSVIGTEFEDSPENSSGDFGLVVYNTIGTPIQSINLEFPPMFVDMNASHVVAANRNNFLVWNYYSPKEKTMHLQGTRHRKERLYHIDDTPSGVAEVIEDLDHSYDPVVSTELTKDPIVCIAVSENTLMLGRESGTLQRYLLPQVALTNRYNLNHTPHLLGINCNSSRIAIVDISGILKFLDLTPLLGKGTMGESDRAKLEAAAKELSMFERKDVWGIKWAEDNPDLIAIMEKNRMYIFKGVEPEEPINCSGYIASFKDLEIRLALLDEIMHCQTPLTTDFLQNIEVKSLRDTRDLLEKVGIPEATTFIEENPHPRLWRLLAEKALQNLELATAEAAYVRCSDYPGISFIKRLRLIQNDIVKRAEIAAHLKNFDLAEQLYLQADRRDLAISMREKLGEWLRVNTLVKDGPNSMDRKVQVSCNRHADELAIQHKWVQALGYYKMGCDYKGQARCYQKLNDYGGLLSMMDKLPERHEMLSPIADMFGAVGMCTEAVKAFLKDNKVQSAIDICITLNKWDTAVTLAQENKLSNINTLLAKYADHLLSRNKIMDAISLYRKANKFIEAAELLFRMCDEEKKKNTSLETIQKLYTLGALLVEDHRKAVDQGHHDFEEHDSARKAEVAKIIDTAWDGAVGYHFFMLALSQLKQGAVDAALNTSIHLMEFEHILDPKSVFSLLALTSASCKAFETCSKAFMKLEGLWPEEMSALFDLRLEIFSKYPPKNARVVRSRCSNCDTMILDTCNPCSSCGMKFMVCMIMGRPIMNPIQMWTCSVCKNNANGADILLRRSCPICRTPVQK